MDKPVLNLKRGKCRKCRKKGFVTEGNGLCIKCAGKQAVLKTNHRMSTLTIHETGRVYHFCSCGYLKPNFPGINWNSA